MKLLEGVILREPSQVILSTNQDKPIGTKAIFKFYASWNLEWLDSRNTSIWSSQTSGTLVSRMRINRNGHPSIRFTYTIRSKTVVKLIEK